MANSLKTFIERVNLELKERKMAAGALAEDAGLFPGQLSLYLKGKKKPSMETIDKISKALGIKPWDMIKPHGALDAPVSAGVALIAAFRPPLTEDEAQDLISVLEVFRKNSALDIDETLKVPR